MKLSHIDITGLYSYSYERDNKNVNALVVLTGDEIASVLVEGELQDKFNVPLVVRRYDQETESHKYVENINKKEQHLDLDKEWAQVDEDLFALRSHDRILVIKYEAENNRILSSYIPSTGGLEVEDYVEELIEKIKENSDRIAKFGVRDSITYELARLMSDLSDDELKKLVRDLINVKSDGEVWDPMEF